MTTATDILVWANSEPWVFDARALLDTAVRGTLPRVKHANWSDEAVAVYVRDNLQRLIAQAPGRGSAKGKWVVDRLCAGILNESFGP